PGLMFNVLSGQAGASGVQVNIYSLTGQLLFEQKASGAQIALDLAQRELANGVYLAVVTSVGPDGRVLAREVRKVVVLR
ncbi:MAG: T9SS type A sorting domain-containing protein, partial [Candidatus Bipolaricaulia bacterium]